MIKAILFDMDGTLLPMDMDVFIGAYFSELARKAAPYGYDKDKLIDAVWKGTGAMVRNDGSSSNDEVFWRVFAKQCGERAYEDKHIFDDFYANEFHNVRPSCGFDPNALRAVNAAKATGAKVALASNPIFPLVAQKNRARWAGIDPEIFDLVTGYENSRFCKPSPGYFSDIASELGVKCEECLIIGNDVDEDMCAAKLGMSVFLVTSNVINREGADTSAYRQGDLAELCDYLEMLEVM